MTFIEALKQYRIQLFVILALLFGVYYPIVPDMVSQWAKDENYSHGFLVPAISAYFFWQNWSDLKGRLIKPDYLGLVLIIFALFQLLLGWVATEYFTMRSSLIVLIAGVTLLMFGREILKGMALPIGYLIFMVPIPYVIYDMVAFPLKLFVTKVSVVTMKLVGVVVMREGNILMFPSTTLEVADACSGIRSLLSLLALAVAYAFFVQTSNLRRWIIIASAIPIAIATNAMRVIVTGILAQWWGEKAAQGFFHEFAGLAVFALAMVMLVAVGALVKGKSGDAGKGGSGEAIDGKTGQAMKRGSEEAESQNPIADVSSDRITALPLNRFLPLCALLVTAALYINLHQNMAVPTNRPFSQFPNEIQSWKMVSETTFSDPVLSVLKPTDYIMRQYRDSEGKEVGLYVGYHNGGKGTGGIHSPKHCLPGSGWYEISSGVFPAMLGGKQEKIVRAVYKKGDSQQLFIYWFEMKDKVLHDEYALKIGEITNSLLYGRKDETFVRIAIPFETDEAQAIARGEKFVRDFYPVIKEFLPR